MKLVDLNPEFVSAGGLLCDCPCGHKHKLYVPFANPIGDERTSIPTRMDVIVWWRTGSTFQTLTLTPEIFRRGCKWYGVLTDGEFTRCMKRLGPPRLSTVCYGGVKALGC